MRKGAQFGDRFSSTIHGGGGGEAAGRGSNFTEVERKKGVLEMSRKYEEMESKLCLSNSGEKREPID